MSDFDFDSALQAQVERQQQAGSAPPAEATEDDVIGKYGEPELDEPAEDEPVDDMTGDIETDDDEVLEDEVDDDETSDDRPRDAKGRFLPKFDDPEIQAYIEKFGGLEQALKVGANAQSLLGRQGQELGELRRTVESIQQRIDQPAPPPPVAPGQFEDAIEEDPGAVAQWAFVNGQEAVYNEAMAAWYEVDTMSAARFERAIELEALKAELGQQAPAAPQMEQVVAQLTAKYDDFAQVVATATPEELEGLDRQIVEELEARNPAAAFEMVYKWVKASRPAVAVAPSQDGGETARREAQATRTAKREAAAVARGSSRPASGDKSTMDLLKESMLSPDPFNVQHGLRSAG